MLLLAGCLVPTPDNYECGMPALAPYGYGLTALTYVAPIAPPVGSWHHPYDGCALLALRLLKGKQSPITANSDSFLNYNLDGRYFFWH